MSDYLQNPSFLIWTKGPAALEALRDALSGHIQAVWINHLETFTLEEIKHLGQFIQDMNYGYAVVKTNKRTKEKEWVLTCNHHLCEILLKRLIEIRTNKHSKKIVWKTNCPTIQTVPGKHFLIGLAEIFDYHRTICKTYYWHIANMFMLYGTEEHVTPNKSPYHTDVSLILKMLKNCTLFKIDEVELYEKVIGIRNKIFHTAHYNMTEEDMHSMIGDMTNLLTQVQAMPHCRSKHKTQIAIGIAKIEEIYKRDVVAISLEKGTEWESMAVQALKLQKQAIMFDISFKDSLTFDIRSLENILKDADDRIQMFTNTDTWRKKEDKRHEEEGEKREKERKELIEPYKERIKFLEDELEKRKNEDKRRKEERENEMEELIEPYRNKIKVLEGELEKYREKIKFLEDKLEKETNDLRILREKVLSHVCRREVVEVPVCRMS